MIQVSILFIYNWLVMSTYLNLTSEPQFLIFQVAIWSSVTLEIKTFKRINEKNWFDICMELSKPREKSTFKLHISILVSP